jgi:hypothetical protein
MLRRTVQTFPRNAMVSIAKLADESTDSIVAPNHDTLYSVGWDRLSAGPLVLETPPTGGRYAVIQLLDALHERRGLRRRRRPGRARRARRARPARFHRRAAGRRPRDPHAHEHRVAARAARSSTRRGRHGRRARAARRVLADAAGRLRRRHGARRR